MRTIREIIEGVLDEVLYDELAPVPGGGGVLFGPDGRTEDPTGRQLLAQAERVGDELSRWGSVNSGWPALVQRFKFETVVDPEDGTRLKTKYACPEGWGRYLSKTMWRLGDSPVPMDMGLDWGASRRGGPVPPLYWAACLAEADARERPALTTDPDEGPLAVAQTLDPGLFPWWRLGEEDGGATIEFCGLPRPAEDAADNPWYQCLYVSRYWVRQLGPGGATVPSDKFASDSDRTVFDPLLFSWGLRAEFKRAKRIEDANLDRQLYEMEVAKRFAETKGVLPVTMGAGGAPGFYGAFSGGLRVPVGPRGENLGHDDGNTGSG